jgi:predicted anti-sigma-YlaC factor YlaD
MQTISQPRCPEDESLAAFSDGELAGEKRAILSAHLLLCSDCYRLFLEAAELRAEREEAPAAASVRAGERRGPS